MKKVVIKKSSFWNRVTAVTYVTAYKYPYKDTDSKKALKTKYKSDSLIHPFTGADSLQDITIKYGKDVINLLMSEYTGTDDSTEDTEDIEIVIKGDIADDSDTEALPVDVDILNRLKDKQGYIPVVQFPVPYYDFKGMSEQELSQAINDFAQYCYSRYFKWELRNSFAVMSALSRSEYDTEDMLSECRTVIYQYIPMLTAHKTTFFHVRKLCEKRLKHRYDYIYRGMGANRHDITDTGNTGDIVKIVAEKKNTLPIASRKLTGCLNQYVKKVSKAHRVFTAIVIQDMMSGTKREDTAEKIAKAIYGKKCDRTAIKKVLQKVDNRRKAVRKYLNSDTVNRALSEALNSDLQPYKVDNTVYAVADDIVNYKRYKQAVSDIWRKVEQGAVYFSRIDTHSTFLIQPVSDVQPVADVQPVRPVAPVSAIDKLIEEDSKKLKLLHSKALSDIWYAIGKGAIYCSKLSDRRTLLIQPKTDKAQAVKLYTVPVYVKAISEIIDRAVSIGSITEEEEDKVYMTLSL